MIFISLFQSLHTFWTYKFKSFKFGDIGQYIFAHFEQQTPINMLFSSSFVIISRVIILSFKRHCSNLFSHFPFDFSFFICIDTLAVWKFSEVLQLIKSLSWSCLPACIIVHIFVHHGKASTWHLGKLIVHHDHSSKIHLCTPWMYHNHPLLYQHCEYQWLMLVSAFFYTERTPNHVSHKCWTAVDSETANNKSSSLQCWHLMKSNAMLQFSSNCLHAFVVYLQGLVSL